jgi:hypothetical protein
LRRLLAPWVFLLVVDALCIGTTYAICPGCLDRHRFNRTCDWAGDAVFSIDVQSAPPWRHLVHDAQLAEELATRFADAEYDRLYGRNCCGGLLEGGQVRERCMAQLVRAIEDHHGVTASQIIRARAERNDLFCGALAPTSRSST